MRRLNQAIRQADPETALRYATGMLRYANAHLGRTSGLALESQAIVAHCLIEIGDPEHSRYALRHLRRIVTISAAGAIAAPVPETEDIVRDASFLAGNLALTLGLASRTSEFWNAALHHSPPELACRPLHRALDWWSRIDAVVGSAAPSISRVAVEEIRRLTTQIARAGDTNVQQLFNLHLKFLDRAIERGDWQGAVDDADGVLRQFSTGLARSPAALVSVLERWLRAANSAERGEPGRAIGAFSIRLQRAEEALELCAGLPLSTRTARAQLEALYTLASTGFGFRAQCLLPEFEESLAKHPPLQSDPYVRELLRQVRLEIDPKSADDEHHQSRSRGFGESWEQHPSLQALGKLSRQTLAAHFGRILLISALRDTPSVEQHRRVLHACRTFTDHPLHLQDLTIADQDHVLQIAHDAARGSRDQIAQMRLERLRSEVVASRMTRELQLHWLPEQLRLVAQQLFPATQKSAAA